MEGWERSGASYRDFKGLEKKPIQKTLTIKPPCPVGGFSWVDSKP